MIERLQAMGYLETNASSSENEWQGLCADRSLKWLETESFVTIGMQFTPPNSAIWLTQATLVLAVCPEGWECGIENLGNDWILWCCYLKDQDDQEIITSLKSHLALANYLESEGLSSESMNKPQVWRGKL